MKSLYSFILFLMLSLGSLRVEAGIISTFQKYMGWKAFEKHDYSKAKENFTETLVDNPDDWTAAYNLGNTYYRQGEFLKAAESFYKATGSSDPKLKEKSVYNLGNSFYKAGQWENAVKSYEEALKIDPQDEEARLNLEFVKRKIQEKQQQDQKNQQNQNQGGEGQEKQQGGKSGASPNEKDSQAQKGQQEQNQQGQDQKNNSNSQEQNQNSQNQSGEQKEQQGQQSQNKENKQDSKSQNPNQSQDQQNSQKQNSQDPNKNSQNQNQSPEQNQNQSTAPKSGEADQGKQGENSKTPPDGKLELRPEQKNQKQEASGSAQVKGGGGDTTHQEAEQWLNTIEEDASQILKNQIQKKIGKTKRVEKDW